MDSIEIKSGIESMDFERITEMLTTAWWCVGIKIDEIKQGACNSSLVAGAYTDEGIQIGYARVISDKTRFAYILDVYIDENFRSKGIGRNLINYILKHDDLKDVYQWLLITKDAHEFYGKNGFTVISRPSDWLEIRNKRPQR